MEPIADILRWLRSRDPQPEVAPATPQSMAETLDAAPADVVSRLLVQTLLRLRPAGTLAAPWLRVAGLAAWRAVLRLDGHPDPGGRHAARLERLRRVIDDNPFGPSPLAPIGLRLADIAAIHTALAAVPNHARILDVITELIGSVHRQELIDDLGPQPGTRTRVPRRDGCAVESTPDGMRLCCTPLPPVDVIATPTHWRLVCADQHLGDAPPNAGLRIARIAILHWIEQWRDSPRWLPEGRDPGGLPPALLRLLSLELTPLCRRLGENDAPGIWTRTLAARLRPQLAVIVPMRFEPAVLAVWRRLCAVAPFPITPGPLGLVTEPTFWSHPWLPKDVVRLRGAATVVRTLCTSPGFDPDEHAERAHLVELLLRSGWMAPCNPASYRQPLRTLRVTLTRCPGGLSLSGWPITLLRSIELPRPRTTRLELLAALVVARRHVTGQQSVNDSLLLEVPDIELRAVLHAAVARGALANLRSARRLCEHLADWLDCPERAGTVGALSRRSERWHRNHPPPIDDLFAESPPLPPKETPLMALPFALPAVLAPGVTIRELRSVGELAEEGACMHHCVAAYARKAMQGMCHIMHIEAAGEAATVELDRHLAIVQAKGPCNERNAATIWTERHLPGLLAAGRRSGAA